MFFIASVDFLNSTSIISGVKHTFILLLGNECGLTIGILLVGVLDGVDSYFVFFCGRFLECFLCVVVFFVETMIVAC